MYDKSVCLTNEGAQKILDALTGSETSYKDILTPWRMITNEMGEQIAEAIKSHDSAQIIKSKLEVSIVTELPTTGERGKLYLIANSNGSGNNLYDEYLWIESTSKFEHVGQAGKFDIELSDGLTDTTETAVKGKAIKSYVDSAVADKAAKTDIPTIDSTLTDGGANAVKGGVIKSYVDNGLAGKAAKTDIPSVDTSLTNGGTNAVQGGAIKSYIDSGLATKQATLTDAQLAAVNSGINSALVTDINKLKTLTNYENVKVYGFHINSKESDPSTAVTYLLDAVGMTPAKMDFTNNKFDYGSWKNAFFMPKPCMLKSDGTVDYYLDQNDYSKKEDGTTASDIANVDYDGNAMMEFPKIYLRVVPDSDDTTSASIYISNKKLDGYTEWNYYSDNGTVKDHFYVSIYNGSKDANGKMRSLSGQSVSKSLNRSAELDAIKLNGSGWYSHVYSDRNLINYLLILISKSLNSQAAFGLGITSSNEDGFNAYVTGADLNDKGLFYGYNDSTKPIKVFGIENWWGLQWDATAGLMDVNGNIKYKFTPGTQDGSTAASYNLTGEGYLDSGLAPSGSSGGYINAETFNYNGAMLPTVASGSSSTYYCDGLWFNNSISAYALYGGAAWNGDQCGSAACHLNSGVGYAWWDIGASLSFR
jgi:hypothetical protein